MARAKLAVVGDDMDEDEFEDEFDLDDEEEEVVATKQRKGSNRTPSDDDDDDDEEDFDEAAGTAVLPALDPLPPRQMSLGALTDDQLVLELTELLLQGDDSEMTSILVPMFTGPRGGKVAKQLVREARDRVIARVKRVANVCQVNIDTFDDD